MNTAKEKSAVGTAIPATEKDINIITENIISADEEKIKSYSENMTAILSIKPVTVPMMNENYVQVAARITYKSGRTKDIDIDCDSGIAAVYDIARKLAFS